MGTPKAVVKSGSESAFSKSELAGRVKLARRELVDRNIDVLLVTGPENIFYLTGQQTPGYYTYQVLLLPVDAEPVFIIRQLEFNNLVANSFLEQIYPYSDDADPVNVTVDVISKLGWENKRLAIDERGWFLPIAVYNALRTRLQEITDGSRVIERLRAVKSSAELEKIERAAFYVEAGMQAGLTVIGEGASENDIVAAMMGEAIAAGSEYVGMEPLVSSGPRCGVPHSTWRRRRLTTGDPIFVEMAACHDRYHAAVMRSAWIGQVPDEARRMMDCCCRALQATLDFLKPGTTCAEVHNVCQGIIDKAGYTENFRKRTGYSIGISFAPDWGEGNVLSLFSGVDTVVQPGMVFHIPPALRVYGQFTVGVSETAIVTEAGNRTLSKIPQKLFEV